MLKIDVIRNKYSYLYRENIPNNDYCSGQIVDYRGQKYIIENDPFGYELKNSEYVLALPLNELREFKTDQLTKVNGWMCTEYRQDILEKKNGEFVVTRKNHFYKYRKMFDDNMPFKFQPCDKTCETKLYPLSEFCDKYGEENAIDFLFD